MRHTTALALLATLATACAPMCGPMAGGAVEPTPQTEGHVCDGIATTPGSLLDVCDKLAYVTCSEHAAEYGVQPHENPISDVGFECVTDSFAACEEQQPSDSPGYSWVGPEGKAYCVTSYLWVDLGPL